LTAVSRQHRRIIVIALNDPSRELPFTTRALAFDSKNYHTWAYRQWALSHFYPDEDKHTDIWSGELEFAKHLLTTDVRNNSAWNHRWFTVFERSKPASEEDVEREIAYTKKKLELAPNNPSAWNYLRGQARQFLRRFHVLTMLLQDPGQAVHIVLDAEGLGCQFEIGSQP
jgi:protein farnesyltransferase/geranylgeranyltransferase type-1 subunit alpha